MSFCRLLLVGAMVVSLSGCLDRLLEFAVNPTSGAIDSANEAGDAMTSSTLGSSNQQAVNDIDRILAENPDTPNRSQLQEMREQLAGQQTAGAVSAGTVTRNKSLRREAPINRTLPRRRSDSLHRLTTFVADVLLPLRPECAVIPPTGVLFEDDQNKPYTMYGPVRMR